MNTKFNLQVNSFPGFYESYLYSSDSEYDEAQSMVDYYSGEFPNLEFTNDDFELDFEDYTHDICADYVEAVKGCAPSIVKSMEYSDMASPKEYNFSTDQLYADVELSDDWLDVMKYFINDNKEWFEKRISKDWTSRDGFMSFMDNTVDEWIENLEQEDERYISMTLAYMMMIDQNMSMHELSDSLSMICLDNIYIGEYMHLTKRKKEEVDEEQKKIDFKKKQDEIMEKYQLKIQFPEDED